MNKDFREQVITGTGISESGLDTIDKTVEQALPGFKEFQDFEQRVGRVFAAVSLYFENKLRSGAFPGYEWDFGPNGVKAAIGISRIMPGGAKNELRMTLETAGGLHCMCKRTPQNPSSLAKQIDVFPFTDSLTGKMDGTTSESGLAAQIVKEVINQMKLL